MMTWWFCSGVDDVVLVDRWREESDLWWCGGGSAVWWWWWSGDREHRKRRSYFRCCFRGGCVVARGVWWWLMGRTVGFFGFRDGWCWFLMRINSGFLVVNGSFGGGVCGSGGYAFCGFFSSSFVVDGVFSYMDVSWCGLFKVRLHEFLVGLMVILERFFNGLTQDLFLLYRRRLYFSFWRWLLCLVFNFYWFRGPLVEGVFGLLVKVYIWYMGVSLGVQHIQRHVSFVCCSLNLLT